MCGIGGFILRRRAERDALERMGERLAHRGPDRKEVFVQGNMGLVHTRLSVIDPEGGNQPLCTSDGHLVLVANGEIYNYKELREQLEFRGHAFSSRSDCEVILHAYREYGDDFIKKLAGMFAFALWDGRRRRLILARDRLGIKPLYRLSTPGGLFFASEIKALLPFIEGEVRLSPRALAEALQNQFTAGDSTLIAGIHRVLPGSYARNWCTE
ncbi:MAG: hypothetical protein D6819_06380 [Gammaproteobacteria bacterium]|nr:MAG: hypothetical protein D6819_06380 [Gammaproteobacteria bacterium]